MTTPCPRCGRFLHRQTTTQIVNDGPKHSCICTTTQNPNRLIFPPAFRHRSNCIAEQASRKEQKDASSRGVIHKSSRKKSGYDFFFCLPLCLALRQNHSRFHKESKGPRMLGLIPTDGSKEETGFFRLPLYRRQGIYMESGCWAIPPGRLPGKKGQTTRSASKFGLAAEGH